MPDESKVSALRADLPLRWEVGFEGVVSGFEGNGIILDEWTETDEGVSQRELNGSWCTDQKAIQYGGDVPDHFWRGNDGAKPMAGDGVGF